MIFSRRLRSQEHTKAFVVDEANDRGWEVREEEDHQIVKRTWMHDLHRVENAMMRFAVQATMLQPVGGMDRIAYAIYDQVKPLVQLNSPVGAIRQTGAG